METLLRDLRLGARMLVKNNVSSCAAVLCLAFGIGANTAIFGFVNALLLRPLPVSEPETLARLYVKNSGGPAFGFFSYPDYRDLRKHAEGLSAVAAEQLLQLNLTSSGRPERSWGALVSGNYFLALGVTAARGRALVPADDETVNPVAVLSHGFWQRRYGADPAALGETLFVNGQPFTIVGVAPAEFTGFTLGLGPELWLPISAQPRLTSSPDKLEARGMRWLNVTARLEPGVTMAAARSAVRGFGDYLKETYPETHQGTSLVTVGFEDARVPPELRGALLGFTGLLMAAAGLVLLIACSNATSLSLARALARQKEIGVRLALGASRSQLIRQLLTESLLLALLAGVVGLALAHGVSRLILRLGSLADAPVNLDLSPDLRVLGFTLGISLVSAVLAGLAPALASTRTDLVTILRDESLNAGQGSRAPMRSILVVVQIAVSLVLLTGAGLFLRGLQQVHDIDPGFDPDGVLIASLNLDLQGYDEARGESFYERLLARLKTLPGVASASLGEMVPLGLISQPTAVSPVGYVPSAGASAPLVDHNVVSPDYFRTLRIPLIRGREFNPQDDEGAPGVVIVNEALGASFWPGEEILGKRLVVGGTAREIVGVVGTGKYRSLTEEPQPYFYLPFAQSYQPVMNVHLRAPERAESFLPILRAEVGALDPHLPLTGARSLNEHLELSLLPARLGVRFLGSFALLALTLASVGLYGALLFFVVRQTRELGIRMAIGATARDVIWLVFKQGMTLTAVGLGVGLLVSLATGRMMASFLHGVSPFDPLILVGMPFTLAVIAFLASLVPARRAARLNPIHAIHHANKSA